MPIVVNGETIPTSQGYILIPGYDTPITKVDVVKDGARTTVWQVSDPISWTLSMSGEPFGTEKTVDISVDTSKYTKAVLEVSGGGFGYGGNGSGVNLSWYGTISEVGTHTVPLGTGTMKLRCGLDNASLACTLTFS